jgi:hypothetical protein
MPELNNAAPRILDPSFEDVVREGDSLGRVFEGQMYRFPSPPSKVVGELTLQLAGRQLKTTAETSIDGVVYTLILGNGQFGIEKLVSEPADLLNKTLAEGETEVDNTIDG